MNTTRSRRASLAAVCCAALVAVTVPTASATATGGAGAGGAPIVTTDNGAARGVAMAGSGVRRVPRSAVRRSPYWQPAVAPSAAPS